MKIPDEVSQAFAYSVRPEVVTNGVSASPFTDADVKTIVATSTPPGDHYGDYQEMIVVELMDGRFAFLAYWADYTFDGGSCKVAANLGDLLRYAMGDEDQKALGL